MANKKPAHPPPPSLEPLLSPTHLLPTQSTCDVYSLRHLILQRGGLPDQPTWLRPQAWTVLLRVLGTEKRDWESESNKKRQEYYSLLEDVLPTLNGPSDQRPHPHDALITQIHLDLIRSRYNAFSFFQEDVPASRECPLAPMPPESPEGTLDRSHKRYALLDRLDVLQGRVSDGHKSAAPAEDPFQAYVDRKSTEEPAPPTQHPDESEGEPSTPSIHLSPPTPAKATSAKTTGPSESRDKRSNCLLRILFLYALLNPTIGYIQGMVEVASVLLWTIGSATGLPTSDLGEGNTTNPHFEADCFWAFSLLLGELKDLWDFEGLDHGQAGLRVQNPRGSDPATSARRTTEVGGMATSLRRLGGRLKWADEDLWRALHAHGLSPSMPYYAFRWLATLLCTSLPLPSLLRIWDALLCETDTRDSQHAGQSSAASSAASSPKIEFFIDILTALLISQRGPLLQRLEIDPNDAEQEQEAFGACLAFLQELPDDDIGPVLELATMLRQRRVAATLTGEGGPPEDELEGEVSATGSNIRDRAFNALKGWRTASGSTRPEDGPSTPSMSSTATAGGWFRKASMGLSSPQEKQLPPSPPLESPSTPTPARRPDLSLTSPSSPSSSGGSLFSKYAQALQSSDAAAEWSKRGTNWTARALDRWNGGHGTSSNPGPTSAPSRRSASEAFATPGPSTAHGNPTSISNISSRFGSVSASFRRNFSASGAPTTTDPANQRSLPTDHPALRFDREHLPDFPLPDVMDSSDARQEYAYFRPQSLMMAGGISGPNGLPQAASPLRNGLPDDWRFPSSADRISTPVRQESRSNTSTSTTSSAASGTPSSLRGAGPKPLLLAGSARAAREDDPNSSIHSTPPASKVVRTGPLAGGGSSSSPYNARRASNMSNGSGVGIAGTPTMRWPPVGGSSSVYQRSLADSSMSSSVQGDDVGNEPVHSRSGSPAPSSRASSFRMRDASEHDNDPSIGSDSIIEHWSDEERESGDQEYQAFDGGHSSTVMSTSNSLQEALRTEGAVPKLPSLQRNAASGNQSRPGYHQHQHSFNNTGPVVARSGAGTIPAGAFGNANTSASSSAQRTSTSSTGANGALTSDDVASTPRSPQVELREEAFTRPSFGTIASSSDVPLVSNEGRQVRRRAGPSSGISAKKRQSSSSSLGNGGATIAPMSPAIAEHDGMHLQDTRLSTASNATGSDGSRGSRQSGSDSMSRVGLGLGRASNEREGVIAADTVLERPRKAPQPPQLADEGEEINNGSMSRQPRYQLSDGPVRPVAEEAQTTGAPLLEKYELSDGPAPSRYQLSDEPVSYQDDTHVASPIDRAGRNKSDSTVMSPTSATGLAYLREDSSRDSPTSRARPASSSSSSLSSSSRKPKVRSKRSFKNSIIVPPSPPIPSPSQSQPYSGKRDLSHDDVPISARDMASFPLDEEDDTDLEYPSYRHYNGEGEPANDGEGEGEEGDMMQAISSAFEKFGRGEEDDGDDGEGRPDERQQGPLRSPVVGAGVVRDHAGGIKF